MQQLRFWYVLFLMVIFANSCDIQKKALKSKSLTEQKNDIEKQEVTVTEETRPGGSVKGSIIPEEKRERDDNGFYKELIQKLTDGGATQTIYYKPDGTVDVDCTADEIWTRIEKRLNERDNTIIDTETKEKEKEKTENFDSSVIVYFMIGAVLLGSVITFLFFRLLSKNTQALTTLLNKV